MTAGDDARSPGDPGELVRRRREIIKALHPDRGGDPAAFIAAMAALEHEARGERPRDATAAAAGATHRDPGGTVRVADGTVAEARFAAPARGAAVHLTLRGRIRQVGRRAARKLRRDSRYIDVTTHLERR